eukprot:382485-Pyramimonas_sp.AAC.1
MPVWYVLGRISSWSPRDLVRVGTISSCRKAHLGSQGGAILCVACRSSGCAGRKDAGQVRCRGPGAQSMTFMISALPG